MWGQQNDDYSAKKQVVQEYTITKVTPFKGRCGFHDGYDKDCFETAIYSLDSMAVCNKHLHIRMRAITYLALESKDEIVLRYTFK